MESGDYEYWTQVDLIPTYTSVPLENQPMEQTIDQPINQSMDQSMEQTVDQPINQSMDLHSQSGSISHVYLII